MHQTTTGHRRSRSVAAAQRMARQFAGIRELIGEEYSVVGVRAGSRGILLVNVPANTAAFADGLRTGDFITRLNGREVKGVDDFLKTMTASQNAALYFLRNQKPMVREVNF